MPDLRFYQSNRDVRFCVAFFQKSLQKDFYKHWEGYNKAPYPKDFEWEQIHLIIDQAMKRSVRYKRLKKQEKLSSQKKIS